MAVIFLVTGAHGRYNRKMGEEGGEGERDKRREGGQGASPIMMA
jgi:hypothetical protein